MTQRHPIQTDAIFFITTVVRDRKPIFVNPTFAREAIETLYRVQELHPFFLFGFVIMPDHCHLLLAPVSGTKISTIMNRWKMGVAHSLGIGQIWQPRYFIRIPDDTSLTLRYIHQNPFKASLSKRNEDYPWSSLSGKWDVTGLGIEGHF